MSRTILITGSRKGIGRYLSEYYLKKGYNVIGCSRSESDLTHKNYIHISGDVSNESDVKNIVKKVVMEEMNYDNIEIEITDSDDKRSYHINSDKIFNAIGFKPNYTIEDAVKSICEAHKNGLLNNSTSDSIYSNVKTMQKLNVK